MLVEEPPGRILSYAEASIPLYELTLICLNAVLMEGAQAFSHFTSRDNPLMLRVVSKMSSISQLIWMVEDFGVLI